ncbi:MAG: endonuclease NucS [Candidatus Micrarchaeota archaeon]
MQLSEAKACVDRALEEGRLAVVVGRCRVQYEGRAASKLSEGDRLLIIKNDGTFLVHQPKGMAAINYQGPGAAILTSIEGGEFAVSALRSRKDVKERIHVKFFDVYSAESFALKDDKSLALFGSERQLSDLIMQDLTVIEKGLVPLQQESGVRKGVIDILARDSGGSLVVIEVKRRQAGLDAVSQLERYVSDLSKRKGARVRGVLCAPAITPNAHTMLERAGLEYFRLDYEIGNPSAKIKGLRKKQKILDEY